MSNMTIAPAAPSAPSSAGALVPQNMDQAIRLAGMMAKTKGLPQHLRGDEGTCLMIVEQAMRWGMSPFAVAQCTSSIQGKLMHEGKLVAAAVECCGGIIGGLDYDFTGSAAKPETLAVKVTGKRASDGKMKDITLRWADAKTDNKFWKSQPEQQLCYAGARVWARRHTPAVLLGVYAPEEFTRNEMLPHHGPTLEHDAEPDASAAHEPDASSEQPKPRTVRDFLNDLRADLDAAQTADDVDAIVARDDVQRAMDRLVNGARAEMTAIMKAARDRTAAMLPAEDGWPGPATDERDVTP